MGERVQVKSELLCAVWADLLESFWNERGEGARYRTVHVGVNWFKARMDALGPVADAQTALDQAIAVIHQEGIAEHARYSLRHDFADVAELQVQGCALRAGEQALLERGCKPYACVCANIAMHLLEKCPDLSTELAEVAVGAEGCTAQIVFFRMS